MMFSDTDALLAMGGAEGGSFIVTSMFHPEGESYFQVLLSEVPTTIDATGWSALIDDIPTPLTFLTVTGKLAAFTIDKAPIASEVYVSYDGAGNTLFEGTQLKPFTDVKAAQTLTGEIRWLAAGSPYTLTDGENNGSPNDHILYGQFLGQGLPAFVTPADMHLPDFEGVYREVEQNTAPWYGGRVVYNASPDSENLENVVGADNGWSTSATITVTPGQPDPVGGNSAFRISADAANGTIRGSRAALVDNQTIRSSWWVRRVTGSGTITMYTGKNGTERPDVTSSIDGTWKRITVQPVEASPNSSSFGLVIATSGDVIDVWRPQLDVLSGAVNDSPSEYVASSTDRLVLNQETFDNLNGNTVLNNVVTEAVGAPLDPVPSLYAAPAATNGMWPSRDLTSQWITRGTATSAYDQVGITGEPNTATARAYLTRHHWRIPQLDCTRRGCESR